MRDGHLKVMIATTIMDEGVDISGIDVLILGRRWKIVTTNNTEGRTSDTKKSWKRKYSLCI